MHLLKKGMNFLMIKQFISNLKSINEKVFKMMKYGLIFSLSLAVFSCSILFTYIFFYHAPFLFDIGQTIFQLSLTLAVEFIICAYAIDLIFSN